MAGAERLRMARELHDITAARVAVIAVHAKAGQSLLPDHPDAAATAFETIATSARATLDDLRRMLGVLRRPDGPAPLDRNPGWPTSRAWSTRCDGPASPSRC